MNTFDRLELLAQRLVEGSFIRLFKLQADPPTYFEPEFSVTGAKSDPDETTEIKVESSTGTASRWYLKLGDGQFKLGEPVISLGRALDNDVILSDPTVSRYHAQLRWRGDRYYLCPPATRVEESGQTQDATQQVDRPRPPKVNRQKVVERPLVSGDLIKLGRTVLTVVAPVEKV